jgi:cold shock CspA family protein
MATGKVLQFDPGRGYGFVAADDGGEDIFLHASVFDGDPSELIPGLPLEFQVMAGDRGRKAFAVRFAQGAAEAFSLAERPTRTTPAPSSLSAQSGDEEQMCDVLPGRIRNGAHRAAAQDDTGAERRADPRGEAGHARVRQEARLGRRLSGQSILGWSKR